MLQFPVYVLGFICLHRAVAQDSSGSIVFPDQVGCGIGSFQCGSNQCINQTDVCDGVPQCFDNSDETTTSCSSITCPGYSYRCRYGACVYSRAKCNGIRDCFDGSDEENCGKNQVPSKTSTGLSCGRWKFKCDSGKCINKDRACDGQADCDDLSDETAAICTKIHCPSYTYRCSYGACINTNLRCNGKNDCTDGSDESDCNLYIRPQFAQEKCVVPENPENGHYVNGASYNQDPYKPGEMVPSNAALVTKCNRGFKTEENQSICVSGTWVPPPRGCSNSCPTIFSVTSVECKLNERTLKSCEGPVNGAVALIFCDHIDEGVGKIEVLVRVCKNGRWESPTTECKSGLRANSDSGLGNVYYNFNK